ncbi:uncharacterized protein LOC106157203 [Lingula anatina]|uniref:Uncharacterized protein LOC106157203 n=1 Tax=Lingula anatina TaxID=7574 RepID=A0A1S3HQC3_LINAN|nr:uncharacterized protein LOC106157203 [Lingula anatina]|eukprot:XP_013388235.1 uncharacterized protein LOC106157203 [Lingula anatina]
MIAQDDFNAAKTTVVVVTGVNLTTYTTSTLDWLVISEANIYTIIVAAALWLIACIVLFVGIGVRNRWCFIPWLIMMALLSLYYLVIIILLLVFTVTYLYWWVVYWLVVVLALGLMALDIYSIVCVGFYFTQLARREAKKKKLPIHLSDLIDSRNSPVYIYPQSSHPGGHSLRGPVYVYTDFPRGGTLPIRNGGYPPYRNFSKSRDYDGRRY